MRFAAFTTVAASAGEATDSAGLLDNLRQQTILAEELGFEAIWLGEHHFTPFGVGDLPNPILLGFKVRWQKWATLARIWSAVLVQTKGLGSSLVTSR